MIGALVGEDGNGRWVSHHAPRVGDGSIMTVNRTRDLSQKRFETDPGIDSAFSDTSVLITGGLGFIGSNLARRLVQLGAHITLIDNLMPEFGGNLQNIADIQSQVTVKLCDIRDEECVSEHLADHKILFNLAGQTSHIDSMNDPFIDLSINAASQLSILEAVRSFNPQMRVVFASTRQLYGRPDYLPVDEEHPIRPVDINGVNKLAGETYHLLYHQVYGVPTTALRLTNTYGPGMRVRDGRQTFLGVWIQQALRGQPITIFGDGIQRRDFTYVDDCVDALLLAAAKPAAIGKIYNLGSPEVVSLRQLADLMIELVPSARYKFVEFPKDRRRIDIGDYFGSADLIARHLGWRPQIFLREGLRRSLQYYEQHGSHYWDE